MVASWVRQRVGPGLDPHPDFVESVVADAVAHASTAETAPPVAQPREATPPRVPERRSPQVAAGHGPGRSRRPQFAAAAAMVALLAAIGTYIALRPTPDSDRAAPADTAASPGTAVVTEPGGTAVGVQPTSTPTTESAGSTPPASARECVPTQGPAGDGAEFPAFSPLGAQPTLTIDLAGWAIDGFVSQVDGTPFTEAFAVQIPGGILVVAFQPIVTGNSFDYDTEHVAIVVNWDGSIREVQCTREWTEFATRLSPGEGYAGGFDESASGAQISPSSDGQAGVSNDGTQLWTDTATWMLYRDNIFSARISGDTALILGCRVQPDEQGVNCTDQVLRAFDVDTGDVLWDDPAATNVLAVTGGFALVGTATDWSMRDLRTGQRLAGQEWPATAFNAIDGSGDVTYTEVSGGVVISTDGRTMTVWLPADAGYPPTSLAL